MPRLIKAAVMTATGQLAVKEAELADPKPTEVLVKIAATAVCHSDLNTLADPTSPVPQVLGHEGAGVVVAVGDEVTTCRVGDKVALSWVPFCGTCAFCAAGHVNLCESAFGPMFAGTLLDGTTRLTLDGQTCYHSSLLSTFAEYTVVPQFSCVPLPPGMPLVPASMIGCGVATGYGAAVRAARVEPGSSVAVFGVGGVGVNAIQGARIAGARTIIACDIKQDNLDRAQAFGATAAVNTAAPDAIGQLKALSDGLGVDYAIDCTGITAVGSLAWQSTRKGGTTVVVGAYPADGELKLPSGGFHRLGRVLRGTFYGDVNPFRDFPIIAGLYLEGRYDLDSLVIKTIGLDEVQSAFDAFHDPAAVNMGRTVIVFEP
jgi:S-(hydroxymethyl)glutathione dehydrogenase/alcohol dehydrogenase